MNTNILDAELKKTTLYWIHLNVSDGRITPEFISVRERNDTGNPLPERYFNATVDRKPLSVTDTQGIEYDINPNAIILIERKKEFTDE